jgi:hypothetical protein
VFRGATVYGDYQSTEVYVRDLATGVTRLVSAGPTGPAANGACVILAVSHDGSRILFSSLATNLVASDPNAIATADVGERLFVKDMVTGALTLVSRSAAGAEGLGDVYEGRLSPDSSTVYFSSGATNLVPDDPGGAQWFRFDLKPLAGSTLTGGATSDALIGDAGRDALFGGGGDDLIQGGNEADLLVGGAGADILEGGPGRDTFAWASSAEGGDTIADFVAATDHLEISAAGFGGGLIAAGSVMLVANSAPAATGAGGQFLYDTDDGRLWWGADGTGQASRSFWSPSSELPH